MSEKDYFENVTAFELRKRRLSRLDTKRALSNIAKKRNGWDQGWTTGKISFMKSFPVKKYPRWFAYPQDNVHMQVSIRLIPGKTAKDAPIIGLKGLEVYYRYIRFIAQKKEPEKSDLPEEERDEFDEFEKKEYIVQTTEWTGTHLSESNLAKSFYQLTKSIGINKIKRILERTRK